MRTLVPIGPRPAALRTAMRMAVAALALPALLALPPGALAASTPAAAAPAQAAAPTQAGAQAKVPVETFTLDNGMRWLLVRRPQLTTVMAGWVAHVGSSNERPGITGVTHLFEHMMFKGTRTIGTTNIERDLQIIQEQEELQEKIRALYREQERRWRRGEIADPFDPASRPDELVALEKKFQTLVEEQRSLMIKDEFDKIYTDAGGSSMNAFTNQDMTVYFIQVPANKLELWFWMESDRLKNLVLREFYSERDVVHEERRMRTESTPTGKYDEMYEAMFWQAHPYGWPVVGWPSDLRMISKAEADEYLTTYYNGNNVTAALVGNFDVEEAKALAKKYFGALRRGDREPPLVTTLEMPQIAEQRLVAECDCQPQIQVGYKTVPFRHKDSYALQVLAGLLNGQTGRLNKALVQDKKIASSAGSIQNSMKWAGQFAFFGETKGDATPEQLETAWYEELKKIQDAPIPAEELQKVKNQTAASAFRRIENPFFLLVQLLLYDGLGDWTYLNDSAEKNLAVTEADVKRVAKQYLTKENRTTGIYYRKAGTAPAAAMAGLDELPPEVRPMIEQQLKGLKAQLQTIDDPAKLEAMLTQMEAQKGSVPEGLKKAFPLFENLIRARLEELSAKPGAPSEKGDSK